MLENTFLPIQFIATILNRINYCIENIPLSISLDCNNWFSFGLNIIIIKPDVQL